MISIRKPTRHVPSKGVGNLDQASQHGRFLALLPAIQRHVKIAFRRWSGERKEEAVQEAVAYAFVAYLRLVQLGKEDLVYASPLASYAVARVRDGRSVGHRQNVLDVSSTICQRRQGIAMERLDQRDERGRWCEILVADRRASPADLAATRIDFREWLESLPRRHRQIVEVMATGEQTRLVARRFGVSPGRVSQLRRKLFDAWQQFQGEV
jgi:hypothetical protein